MVHFYLYLFKIQSYFQSLLIDLLSQPSEYSLKQKQETNNTSSQ